MYFIKSIPQYNPEHKSGNLLKIVQICAVRSHSCVIKGSRFALSYNGANQGAAMSCVCLCTKGVHCRFIQNVRISVFVQPRRVHMFIINCLLKNKFNMYVIYYLHI